MAYHGQGITVSLKGKYGESSSSQEDYGYYDDYEQHDTHGYADTSGTSYSFGSSYAAVNVAPSAYTVSYSATPGVSAPEPEPEYWWGPDTFPVRFHLFRQRRDAQTGEIWVEAVPTSEPEYYFIAVGIHRGIRDIEDNVDAAAGVVREFLDMWAEYKVSPVYLNEDPDMKRVEGWVLGLCQKLRAHYPDVTLRAPTESDGDPDFWWGDCGPLPDRDEPKKLADWMPHEQAGVGFNARYARAFTKPGAKRDLLDQIMYMTGTTFSHETFHMVSAAATGPVDHTRPDLAKKNLLEFNAPTAAGEVGWAWERALLGGCLFAVGVKNSDERVIYFFRDLQLKRSDLFVTMDYIRRSVGKDFMAHTILPVQCVQTNKPPVKFRANAHKVGIMDAVFGLPSGPKVDSRVKDAYHHGGHVTNHDPYTVGYGSRHHAGPSKDSAESLPARPKHKSHSSHHHQYYDEQAAAAEAAARQEAEEEQERRAEEKRLRREEKALQKERQRLEEEEEVRRAEEKKRRREEKERKKAEEEAEKKEQEEQERRRLKDEKKRMQEEERLAQEEADKRERHERRRRREREGRGHEEGSRTHRHHRHRDSDEPRRR